MRRQGPRVRCAPLIIPRAASNSGVSAPRSRPGQSGPPDSHRGPERCRAWCSPAGPGCPAASTVPIGPATATSPPDSPHSREVAGDAPVRRSRGHRLTCFPRRKPLTAPAPLTLLEPDVPVETSLERLRTLKSVKLGQPSEPAQQHGTAAPCQPDHALTSSPKPATRETKKRNQKAETPRAIPTGSTTEIAPAAQPSQP